MCRVLARRILTVVALLTAFGAPAATRQKPYPVFTLDHLVATMKTLGPNFEASTAALASRDDETAKAMLIRSREQLATTITYWRDHERDDAIGFLRAALTGLDGLDDALSADTIDRRAVTALVGEVETACAACHAVYRDEDPDTGGYRLKPGVIP